jgi:hypothetical protein
MNHKLVYCILAVLLTGCASNKPTARWELTTHSPSNGDAVYIVETLPPEGSDHALIYDVQSHSYVEIFNRFTARPLPKQE